MLFFSVNHLSKKKKKVDFLCPSELKGLETKISGSYIQHPYLPPVCLWIHLQTDALLAFHLASSILKANFIMSLFSLNLSLATHHPQRSKVIVWLPVSSWSGPPHPVAPASPPYTPTMELAMCSVSGPCTHCY